MKLYCEFAITRGQNSRIWMKRSAPWPRVWNARDVRSILITVVKPRQKRLDSQVAGQCRAHPTPGPILGANTVGEIIAVMTEADRARNEMRDEFVGRINHEILHDLKEVIALGYLGQWTGSRVHYEWLISGICEYYASGLKDTKILRSGTITGWFSGNAAASERTNRILRHNS